MHVHVTFSARRCGDDYDFYPGDTAVLPIEDAKAFGAAVAIGAEAPAPVLAEVPTGSEERGGEVIPRRDRMQRQSTNRAL